MKAKKETKPRKTADLVRRDGLVPTVAVLATEIQDLIETARSHVSVTANLAMVNLYWNIGRIIAEDIQKNEKRAGYGEQLLEGLSDVLTREYGPGYSRVNLQEMRRFSLAFEICQTVSNESAVHPIRSTVSNESRILQTASAESCEPVLIDFRKHFRLGWSHYRLLLGQGDPLCRKFYFEQAAEQRWTVRELRRQIDRGLFERVALSRNIPRLVAQDEGSRVLDASAR
ncbi:MAG: hypothetical protein A2Y76_11010 [Planctomycetes bacterium RBG_13_60_9]|nr:MAG: hypothetical protein A2Y76_11010 [Planctomycetes bacterium RBG_13_60_9]